MKAKRHLIPGILITLLSAGAALANGGSSAQDSDIAVTPVVRQFPVTIIGDSSAPAGFTVTNLSAGPLAIGSIDLAGLNADNFDITGNSCPASLAAGASCIVSVSFTPTDKGTKSALLRIASGSAQTPTLTAYLTNSVGAAVEARQRMPAVLSGVDIPPAMTVNTSYDISWTLEGYDASYQAYAVLFDCTGINDGSCGNSYSDPTRFAESAELTPTTTVPGNWSYGGVTATAFTYHWNFTPVAGSGGNPFATSPGTDVVVRFYQKSDIDAARNNSGVSLLIPGNQLASYYDTAGRRILIKIHQ